MSKSKLIWTTTQIVKIDGVSAVLLQHRIIDGEKIEERIVKTVWKNKTELALPA